MNIAILTKQQDGSLLGHFPSLNLRDVSFEKVAKTKDNSPDYRISTEGAELGAAWVEKSDGGTTYLRATIDSPAFPAPAYCAVFQSKDDANTYAVAWNRKKPKKDEQSSEAPSEF